MNTHRLQSHPRTPGEFVQGIEVRVAADPGTLRLRYLLEGDLRRIRIPPASGGGRADHLWAHTCFEAFLRVEDAPRYLELNFSPSGQWAAYCFDGYRDGMRPPELEEPPRIMISRESAAAGPGGTVAEGRGQGLKLALEAVVSLPVLAGATGRRLRLGLAAVVEDEAGRLSYWALYHAAGRPDFHHPDAFTLELPCS